MNDEDRLDINAAAAVLGVHRRTVFRYIREGRLAAFKHAGRAYVARSEIDAYFTRLQMEGDRQRVKHELKARGSAA